MSNDSSKSETPSDQTSRKKWLHRGYRTDLGSPWLVILNVLIIFVVSQIFAAIFVQLGLNLARLSPDSITTSAGAQFAYVLIAEGMAVGSVFYILKARGLKLGSIGLGRGPRKSDLYKAGLAFLVFYALLIIVARTLSLIFPELNNGEQDVGFNNLGSKLDIFIAFFALVLLPPIGEEILVRGYLYSGLRQRLKFLPSMIITSIIFGAAHLLSGAGSEVLWAAGLNTFVLSIVLVYLRQSTGALYAGMLVHMVNNLIAFGIYLQ